MIYYKKPSCEVSAHVHHLIYIGEGRQCHLTYSVYNGLALAELNFGDGFSFDLDMCHTAFEMLISAMANNPTIEEDIALVTELQRLSSR